MASRGRLHGAAAGRKAGWQGSRGMANTQFPRVRHPGEGHWWMSPLLGAAARRRGRLRPDSDQRDEGSWPCQSHENRAVHSGLFSRKQLGKTRIFILGE